MTPGRIPFTVRLDAATHRQLRQLALDEHTTAAELVRQAIDRLVTGDLHRVETLADRLPRGPL